MCTNAPGSEQLPFCVSFRRPHFGINPPGVDISQETTLEVKPNRESAEKTYFFGRFWSSTGLLARRFNSFGLFLVVRKWSHDSESEHKILEKLINISVSEVQILSPRFFRHCFEKFCSEKFIARKARSYRYSFSWFQGVPKRREKLFRKVPPWNLKIPPAPSRIVVRDRL